MVIVSRKTLESKLHHIYTAVVMDYNKANTHVYCIVCFRLSHFLLKSTLIARKNNIIIY